MMHYIYDVDTGRVSGMFKSEEEASQIGTYISLPEVIYNFNDYMVADGTLVLSLPLISIDEVRIERDKLLLESDWRMSIADYPHSDRDAWIIYRQELRDFPSNYTPTENPEWPTPPSG